MDLLKQSKQRKVLSFNIQNSNFQHFGLNANDIVVLGQVNVLQNNKIFLIGKNKQYYFGLLCHICDNLWSLNTAPNEVLLFTENEVTIVGEVFSLIKFTAK